MKKKYKISRSELKAMKFTQAKNNVKISGVAPKVRDTTKIAAILKKIAV